MGTADRLSVTRYKKMKTGRSFLDSHGRDGQGVAFGLSKEGNIVRKLEFIFHTEDMPTGIGVFWLDVWVDMMSPWLLIFAI